MKAHRPPCFLPSFQLKIKRPKLRRSVTVCIAAITLEKCIVTVSDTMVTSFASSIDASTSKMESFGRDWEAMWAADDITQCIPIIERARRYFQNRTNTLQVARSCFKRAYQQHLSEMAADEVLGRYGIGMKEFLKSRSKRFTENLSQSLMLKIQQVKTDWQFLACGFDAKKQPHLFIVEELGKDAVYDSLGFCAIGSGRYAAESLLFQLQQNTVSTVPKTLINLLCAKFMAEKVGVGKNTYIFIMKPGSSMCSIPTWVEPTIRKRWEDQIQPKIPDDLLHQVADAEIALT
jgi:hypothetical protein